MLCAVVRVDISFSKLNLRCCDVSDNLKALILVSLALKNLFRFKKVKFGTILS